MSTRPAFFRSIAPALILASLACSGGGASGVETGTPDSGQSSDEPEADAGLTDAGMACDPTQGSGCGTNGCVWFLSGEREFVQCRVVGDKALSEACSVQLQDCANGMTCIRLGDDMGPTCHQVCRPRGSECESIPGGAYACRTLQGTSGDYGICRLTGGRCDPLNDMCAQNQVCSLVDGDTVCELSGSTPIGGDCSQSRCRRGSICLNLRDSAGPRCLQPCDTMAMVSECMTGRCAGLQGLDFGVCLEE